MTKRRIYQYSWPPKDNDDRIVQHSSCKLNNVWNEWVFSTNSYCKNIAIQTQVHIQLIVL